MRDVLPVTTLTMLVTKKTTSKTMSCDTGTIHTIKGSEYLQSDALLGIPPHQTVYVMANDVCNWPLATPVNK